VFENRVQGEIFSPKREESRGQLTRLHKVELLYLYCSPNIIHVIK